MKYMTFNSSCSFAGVANMLLQFGIDVEDRQIALGMKLPYLFDLQEGVYSAGPMLQTSDWFNLYLRTLGHAMKETIVSKWDIPDHLLQCGVAMLGLRVSQREKHAVVFVGMDRECFRFINNKWEHSDEPEMLTLSKEELLDRLDDTVMVATIGETIVANPDLSERLVRSCRVLEQYKADVQMFADTEKTKEELTAAMNTLFRATLLDGITMLELIDQRELTEEFRQIQKTFLAVLREGKPVLLREKLDMPAWLAAIDRYIDLIKNAKVV